MYEVSDFGRVRRIARIYGHGPGGVLRPGISNGYPHVMISDGDRLHGKSVHRLVGEVFMGPCPPGLIVNHKDGNKKNNSADNLEYVTASENNQHASRIGLLPKGERHGMSKLSDSAVRKMRNLWLGGSSFADLGREFGVSYVAARNAIKGRTWTHVK